MNLPGNESVGPQGLGAHRKILTLTLGLFLLAGFTGATGTVLVSLGGGSRVDVAPEGTLDVPVQVGVAASAENLASLDVRITWDPTKLAFVSGTGGEFGTLTVNDTDVANGVLRVALFSATGTTSDFEAGSFVMSAADLAEPTLTTINIESGL